MAFGYAIALCLAGAGAVLLAIGLGMLRAEAQAKALELKMFLTTGAAPPAPRIGLKPPPAANVDDLPVLPIRPAQAADEPSGALLALRRAYEPPRRLAS